MSVAGDALAARVRAVRERIAQAASRAGRDPESVRLIGVSKGFSADDVVAAVDAGVADIGENRVQEARAKLGHLAHTARWHLIGHLQTNKAKAAAEMFDAVHSVDSERIARALALHRPIDAEPLAALLELELTGIGGRTGIGEADAESLLRAAAGLPGLHVLGLMTIAPPVADVNDARPYFVRLRRLRDRLEDRCGWPLPELSMGMSDDFEMAVEEGSTMVRIGRAIFGERV